MRIALLAFALTFALPATAAFAQPQTRYTVTATVGGPYAFEDQSILPDFETENAESTIAFEAAYGSFEDDNTSYVAFTYRHAEIDGEEGGNGDRVALSFVDSSCPPFAAVGCTLRVQWQDSNSETVTYRAAVNRAIEAELPFGIEAEWEVALDAITGDRSAFVVSPELTFTRKFNDWFSVVGNVGASWSDDSGDTEPTWGLELGYLIPGTKFKIAAGYSSSVTFDDDTEEFGEPERAATLSLRYRFGSAARAAPQAQ